MPDSVNEAGTCLEGDRQAYRYGCLVPAVHRGVSRWVEETLRSQPKKERFTVSRERSKGPTRRGRKSRFSPCTQSCVLPSVGKVTLLEKTYRAPQTKAG
jgi:hypothetical protein